jgi:hypothetical protein
MKNTQKEIFTFNNAPGQYFQKIEWGVICLGSEQFTIFIFWLSLKQKLLYAYTENTLNGEISTESVYISVNNNTNSKKFLILSIYTIWDRLCLKSISRYCPFKAKRFPSCL